MPTFVVHILLGGVALGTILALLGFRGRRLNRDPVCRDCGFNLSSTLPDGVTCPECGAGLKRPRATRVGERRRMPIVIGLGALLTLLGLLPIAALAFAKLAGTNLDSYKTARLLAWEMDRSAKPRAEVIVDELLDRMLKSKTSAEETEPIVETVLRMQADLSSPWSSKYGDLIERAQMDDRLTTAQRKRYLSQSCVFELETRGRLRPGDELPIAVRLREVRLAQTTNTSVYVSFENIDIGGHKIDESSGLFVRSWGRDATLSFFVNGSTANPSPANSVYGAWGRQGRVLNTSGFLSNPGPSEVVARIRYSVVDPNGPTPVSTVRASRMSVNPDTDLPQVTLRAPIEITPPGEPSVRPVPPTAELQDKLVRALAIESSAAASAINTARLTLRVSTAKLPVDIAFDIYAAMENKRWTVGSVTTGRPMKYDASEAAERRIEFGRSKQLTFDCPLRSFRADTMDLIFKPSADLANQTIDLTSYYGGEIVLRDVPVNWTTDKPRLLPEQEEQAGEEKK